jgi:hypothetical protein
MLKSIRIVPVPHPFGGEACSIHAVIAAESAATGAFETSWYQIAPGGKNSPSACEAHSVLSSPGDVAVPVPLVSGPDVSVGSVPGPDVGPPPVVAVASVPPDVGAAVGSVSEDMVVGPWPEDPAEVEPAAVASVSLPLPAPPPGHADAASAKDTARLEFRNRAEE